MCGRGLLSIGGASVGDDAVPGSDETGESVAGCAESGSNVWPILELQRETASPPTSWQPGQHRLAAGDVDLVALTKSWPTDH